MILLIDDYEYHIQIITIIEVWLIYVAFCSIIGILFYVINYGDKSNLISFFITGRVDCIQNSL